MVSGSPRIESIQHLAAGEVGEIAGAIALRSGFQHLVFVLGQAKYYQAVSSVTAHSSTSSAPTVMKRRAICACGAPSTAQTISWLTTVPIAHCFSSEACTLKVKEPEGTFEADSCTATVSPALTVAVCTLSVQLLLELIGQPMLVMMPLI